MKRPVWYTQGSESDYRFSLANERTFLAWIRTALALLGGGLLVTQIAGLSSQPVVMLWVGLALTVLAAGISAGAFAKWKANEIALRLGAPLPSSYTIRFTAAGLCLLGIVLVLLLTLQLQHA